MSDEVVWGLVVVLWFIFGILLGYGLRSRREKYTRNAGEIEVSEDTLGRQTYSLNLNCEPEDLLAQKAVIFHIVDGRG